MPHLNFISLLCRQAQLPLMKVAGGEELRSTALRSQWKKGSWGSLWGDLRFPRTAALSGLSTHTASTSPAREARPGTPRGSRRAGGPRFSCRLATPAQKLWVSATPGRWADSATTTRTGATSTGLWTTPSLTAPGSTRWCSRTPGLGPATAWATSWRRRTTWLRGLPRGRPGRRPCSGARRAGRRGRPGIRAPSTAPAHWGRPSSAGGGPTWPWAKWQQEEVGTCSRREALSPTLRLGESPSQSAAQSVPAHSVPTALTVWAGAPGAAEKGFQR